MALGTEPGWTREITPSRLNYDGDYGETKIMVPNPGAMPGPDGERYVTDRLKVDVARGECSDGMSDRRYRDTVTVTADGKTVKGCGGGILPPTRSEEHTSELQSLMRISYAVFCLKKKTK